MLKTKLRAVIVGSVLLACTAIAPALASGSSLTDREVQQDKMKDDKMGQDKMGQDKMSQDKMGQDKMASNKMSHRRRRHRRHKKPTAGTKMDKMQNKKQ